MSDQAQSPGDWVKTWIEGQKAALEQWLSGQRGSTGPVPAGAFADLLPPAVAAARAALDGGMPGGQMAALWGLLGSAFPGLLKRPLESPAIGPLREQQASMQELAGALAEYQRLTIEMATVLAKVHADTLDLLARRSLELANAGQPLETFKALHDLWVECGEVTFAKVAHGESYCRLQAALCNAGIRVQAQQQRQIERWLKQLDLPTRTELNTLHLRVLELQRLVDSAASARAAPGSSRPKRKRSKSAASTSPLRSKASPRARRPLVKS
jgi:class III poly(R)-hydroxyalkanoic acid synthase PhaE subunit